MLPVIWNEHVYSTAMLSIYCGQVTALVEFVEINTPRRMHGTCFSSPLPLLFEFAMCRCYLGCNGNQET